MAVLTTYNPSTQGVLLPSVVWADLQTKYTAAENPNVEVSCPDGPTGASLAYSDGAVWRLFAKGEQLMFKMADASGVANFTWSPAFAGVNPPLIFVELYDTSGDNLAVEYKIYNKTTTGATVKVKRQALLGALTSLLNFDVFSGGNLAAIQVSVLIKPPPAVSG